MASKDLVSSDVMQELTNKIQEIVNNYCWNFEEYTPEEVEQLFDADSQEINYYQSLIKNNTTSKNFLWSSSKVVEEISKAILEANEYTDSLLKNISSIKLEYVTSLPTSDISESTIYILKSTDGTSNDTLNLYNTTNGWTEIGDFTIDLTNYIDKTTYDTDMSLKANKTEVLTPDDIKTDITATDLTNGDLLGAKVVKDAIDSKANDSDVVKKTDMNVSQIDLKQYVNTDLFDTNDATVNVIKCGRNVQLNVQGLIFKQEMDGLNNLVVLNAIPEEYRPLTLTETTMYATNNNTAGRGFIDSNGILYNFFYYDSTKGSSKIGGYLFGTFNYISAK